MKKKPLNKVIYHTNCYENIAGKQWILENSETKEKTVIPFGQIAIDMLNVVINSIEKNKYNEQQRKNASELNVTSNFLDKLETIAAEHKEFLYNIIDKFLILQNEVSNEKNKMYSLYIWKCIRHLPFLDIFDYELNYFSDKNNKNIDYDLGNETETKIDNLFCKYIDKSVCTNKGKAYFCNKYLVGNPAGSPTNEYYTGLFSKDLFYLLTNNNLKIKRCNRCNRIFVTDVLKRRYCRSCYDDVYNSTSKYIIQTEQRKKNKERYMHTQILNKLYYKKIDTSDFLQESNYYYAIVKGKTPKTSPKNINADIKTLDDYRKWLENYKASI